MVVMPEVDEDLGADAVLPAVDGQAELEVGVDGVAALVLQGVGPQLVGDADAPALVAPQVDHHAHACLGHPLDGGGQLEAAVAAQRPEHVAGEALGVDPDQHVLVPCTAPRTRARCWSPSRRDS